MQTKLKNYQKLDVTLKYISANETEKGIEAMDVFNLSGEHNGISNQEQWKVLMKLEKDGYIKRHFKTERNPNGDEKKSLTKLFSTTYDGIIFIENGGYKIEFAIKKREKLHSKVSQWFNILWKPFAIVIGLLTIFKLIISLMEYLSN